MTIKPSGMAWWVMDGDRLVAKFGRKHEAEHFCRMQWRPVSEPVPEEFCSTREKTVTLLLIVPGWSGVLKGCHYRFPDSRMWTIEGQTGDFHPTWWMPLPLAPKEGE